MKEFLSDFFVDWKKPVMVYVSTVIILFLSFIIDFVVFSNIAFVLFLLAMALLALGCFYHLIFKDRKSGITLGLTFISGIVIIGYITVAYIVTNVIDGDHYADNLTIPTNVKYDSLIDRVYPYDKAAIEAKRKATDFQLYRAGQPGRFEYDVWLSGMMHGEVYLRAYELTYNDRLSASRMTKASKLTVDCNSDTATEKFSSNEFAVYEGDWGKRYAARFELWFVPADESDEKKLMEKNYIIEGWQH